MRHAEPSARNFAIYCAVEFEGAALRKVADEHQISPTRVQQIVDQARAWYIESTPEWVRELDPHQQPIIACRLHDARLRHLYSESMQAWRASQCEITTTRVRPGVLGNDTVKITKRSFGEPRYLTAALQYSRAQIDVAERLCEIIDRLEERGVKRSSAPEDVELVYESDEAGDARYPREQHCDETLADTSSAPCAPATSAATEVAEADTEVVTLSLDAAVGCIEPIALPLATSVARNALPTPVRNRKQQRKWERHQRRAALRKG